MTIKKAELHVHLEGTISPALAQKMAKKNNLTIPDGIISDDGTSYLSRDFLHFLQVYDIIADLIKTPQDYYDLTLDYLKSCALEDTIYVEMMYSPDHAEKASGIPSIEHLHAIQAAINDAEVKHNIVGRIILTAVRHFGADSANKVAQEICKQTVPCVTGFGLGGDEAQYPPALFKKAYEIAANEAGLSCTVHAGEFASYTGMLEAIENLPVKRIGHGVNAMHSPDTIKLLMERNIALELCPTSNIQLQLFKNINEHPLPLFLNSGINISINSDDPPFMRTTVGREYRIVQEAFGYSDRKMHAITAMAINCGFIDQATKDILLRQIAV